MLRANKLWIWAGVKPPEVGVHKGILQNGNVTKQHVLQNATYYKTVQVTQWYMLNKNGTVNKRHVLQNGIWQKNALSGGHLELCLRAGRDGYTTTSPGGGRHGGPDWRGQ
jgi:hypothetical protein